MSTSEAEFDRRLAELELGIRRRVAQEEEAARLAEGARRYTEFIRRMHIRVPEGEPVPEAEARRWAPKAGGG